MMLRRADGRDEPPPLLVDPPPPLPAELPPTEPPAEPPSELPAESLPVPFGLSDSLLIIFYSQQTEHKGWGFLNVWTTQEANSA